MCIGLEQLCWRETYVHVTLVRVVASIALALPCAKSNSGLSITQFWYYINRPRDEKAERSPERMLEMGNR
jgi:hypothetical protein